MKKVGIITHPLYINYGGILQNYALQQVLIKMGYDPITFRLSNPSVEKKSGIKCTALFLINIVKWIAKKIIGRNENFPISEIKKYEILKINENTMNAFVKECIRSTESVDYLTMDELENNDIEALIVGSDQVWRPKLVNNILWNYFCEFAIDSNIKKIAYAASFGTDDMEYDLELQEKSKALISRFSRISVREVGGINLAKKYWGIDADFVLDPTLLLEASDYEKLIKENTLPDEKYIFAYILDATPKILEHIHKYAIHNKCNVKLALCGSSKLQVSISLWLSLIKNANYIITDSFHGSVFSIIFQKQFLCINNISRGLSRMDNLKGITGLSDRFVKQIIDFPTSEIDYKLVSKRLLKYRKFSKQFLSDSLL